MDQSFKRFLQKLQQNMLKMGVQTRNAEILVACSGGLDSVCLVHSLHISGFKIQVAHVNYKLRAEESDQNENFVAELCSALNIPLHHTSFETKAMLKSDPGNLQEFARELRYDWFRKLIKDNNLDYLATAHHSDDQAETLMYHFIRGSGLNGLSGMVAQRNQIIRPFINFTKDEILKTCESQGWAYSQDSSNEQNDYTRNFIRNRIMPLVQKINPGIAETLGNQARLYNEMNKFLKWSAQKYLQDLKVNEEKFSTDLDIDALKLIPGYIVLLYDYLRPLGFTNDQIQQIAAAIESNETGLLLHSKSHKLLVDRSALKLSVEMYEIHQQTIIWLPESDRLELPDGMTLVKSSSSPDNVLHQNRIQVDIQFQRQNMYLRHWQKGDVFQPVGMDGKSKKISDYFIDSKLNRFQKDKMWLLVNDSDEIIWIAGMRADHRFAVHSKAEALTIYIDPKK